MQRRPLQDDIYESVVEYITNSALASGARVRDTDVATELGVSRTPVREALYRLQRDGLIDHPVGRGFRVRPLSMTEAEATYPILWTLEGLALRMSGPLATVPGKMEELDRLARAIEAAPTALGRVALDNDWHTLLLAECRNPRLLQMIADLKTVCSPVRSPLHVRPASRPPFRLPITSRSATCRAPRYERGGHPCRNPLALRPRPAPRAHHSGICRSGICRSGIRRMTGAGAEPWPHAGRHHLRRDAARDLWRRHAARAQCDPVAPALGERVDQERNRFGSPLVQMARRHDSSTPRGGVRPKRRVRNGLDRQSRACSPSPVPASCPRTGNRSTPACARVLIST